MAILPLPIPKVKGLSKGRIGAPLMIPAAKGLCPLMAGVQRVFHNTLCKREGRADTPLRKVVALGGAVPKEKGGGHPSPVSSRYKPRYSSAETPQPKSCRMP